MRMTIVVDVQNDFIDGALGTPEAKIARDNLVEKLKQEDEGTIVIFTRDTHQDASYLDTLEGKKLPIKHCIAYTNGWNIDDKIYDLGTKNRVYDIVSKHAFGSFSSLALAIHSFCGDDNYSPFEIEICGLCTDICVVSNALILRAAFPDTPITLDSKCCAGTTPAAHEAALTVMRSCQIDVV